ncbi:uncharacterized protein LOC109842353, partial [Asparagus officinalis]|uniref:uncharacterized protein LOC109842353 n=1 Tax=Asparagus officinalis TaxID=4686 RepID=UPI00098E6580
LNTSIDLVQGALQKYSKFWHRVATYYQENKTFSSDRDKKGLEHRWSAIQTAVSKFCRCFNQIEARNQSGVTENDKVLIVASNYGNDANVSKHARSKDKHIASEITPVMLFIDEMRQDRKEKESKRAELFDQIYVQEQERTKIEQAKLQIA